MCNGSITLLKGIPILKIHCLYCNKYVILKQYNAGIRPSGECKCGAVYWYTINGEIIGKEN